MGEEENSTGRAGIKTERDEHRGSLSSSSTPSKRRSKRTPPANTSPPRTSRPRTPPTLQVSLSQTGLLFSPLDTRLLAHVPSTLILPARVSSTALAHTTVLHIRSTILLLHSTSGTPEALLRLPAHALTVVNDTIKLSNHGKKPLFIRPAPGNISPLLKAFRPAMPPRVTILRRVASRVFIAAFRHRKVAIKLFEPENLPEYAIPTRAVLQRARGEGVTPLLAAIQGRGYCGLVMPLCVDLGSYVEKFGKLGAVESRGVVAGIVGGICRVDEIGGIVGEFGREHVLLHPRGAMISRVTYVDALHGKSEDVDRAALWAVTMASVVTIVRECCELGEKGEDFVRGCDSSWSAEVMRMHPWVHETRVPRLRRIRVRGTKEVGDIPKRIGSGSQQGILGWEFVYR